MPGAAGGAGRQEPSGDAEQQPEFGVGGLAIFGDVQWHGVLVTVDEHESHLAETIPQTGDRAQQRRAITP